MSLYSEKYIDNFNKICNESQFKWNGKSCDSATFFNFLVEFSKKLSSSNKILFYGNGASHSFAEHMALDWSKNGKIMSITLSNNALLTALSNDYSYEDAFRKHLEMNYKPGDLVVTISSSGNSKNIIKVIDYCNDNNIVFLTLSGLKQSNYSKNNSKNLIYVPAKTYGVVECAHQLFLHLWLDNYMNIYDWDREDEQNMNSNDFNL